jgi:hypothetical protein
MEYRPEIPVIVATGEAGKAAAAHELCGSDALGVRCARNKQW